MTLPAYAPGPLTAEELTAALCQVLAAYTGQRPTDTQIRRDAGRIAAVAEQGWGAVRLEWDHHFLRAVEVELPSVYPNPQR